MDKRLRQQLLITLLLLVLPAGALFGYLFHMGRQQRQQIDAARLLLTGADFPALVAEADRLIGTRPMVGGPAGDVGHELMERIRLTPAGTDFPAIRALNPKLLSVRDSELFIEAGEGLKLMGLIISPADRPADASRWFSVPVKTTALTARVTFFESARKPPAVDGTAGRPVSVGSDTQPFDEKSP